MHADGSLLVGDQPDQGVSGERAYIPPTPGAVWTRFSTAPKPTASKGAFGLSRSRLVIAAFVVVVVGLCAKTFLFGDDDVPAPALVAAPVAEAAPTTTIETTSTAVATSIVSVTTLAQTSLEPTAVSAPSVIQPPLVPADGTSYFSPAGWAISVGPGWQPSDLLDPRDDVQWNLCCDGAAPAAQIMFRTAPVIETDVVQLLPGATQGLVDYAGGGTVLESGVVTMPDGRVVGRAQVAGSSGKYRYETVFVVKDGIATSVHVVVPSQLWDQYAVQFEPYLATLTRP